MPAHAVFLHPWPFATLHDLEALMDPHDDMAMAAEHSHVADLSEAQKAHLSREYGWTTPGVLASFTPAPTQAAAATATPTTAEWRFVAYSDVTAAAAATTPRSPGGGTGGGGPRCLLGATGLIKREALVVKVRACGGGDDDDDSDSAATTTAPISKGELAAALLWHASTLSTMQAKEDNEDTMVLIPPVLATTPPPYLFVGPPRASRPNRLDRQKTIQRLRADVLRLVESDVDNDDDDIATEAADTWTDESDGEDEDSKRVGASSTLLLSGASSWWASSGSCSTSGDSFGGENSDLSVSSFGSPSPVGPHPHVAGHKRPGMLSTSPWDHMLVLTSPSSSCSSFSLGVEVNPSLPSPLPLQDLVGGLAKMDLVHAATWPSRHALVPAAAAAALAAGSFSCSSSSGSSSDLDTSGSGKRRRRRTRRGRRGQGRRKRAAEARLAAAAAGGYLAAGAHEDGDFEGHEDDDEEDDSGDEGASLAPHHFPSLTVATNQGLQQSPVVVVPQSPHRQPLSQVVRSCATQPVPPKPEQQQQHVAPLPPPPHLTAGPPPYFHPHHHHAPAMHPHPPQHGLVNQGFGSLAFPNQPNPTPTPSHHLHHPFHHLPHHARPRYHPGAGPQAIHAHRF